MENSLAMTEDEKKIVCDVCNELGGLLWSIDILSNKEIAEKIDKEVVRLMKLIGRKRTKHEEKDNAGN